MAKANSEAIQLVATAISQPGGSNAVNYKVAEQYVDAFKALAKTNNTLILPANVADIGSLVASGLQIVTAHGNPKTKP